MAYLIGIIIGGILVLVAALIFGATAETVDELSDARRRQRDEARHES